MKIYQLQEFTGSQEFTGPKVKFFTSLAKAIFYAEGMGYFLDTVTSDDFVILKIDGKTAVITGHKVEDAE